MRKMFAALAALVFALAVNGMAQLITVGGFNDVKFWSGAGTNSSVLVLQFGSSDVPESVAWGYRWSGSATLQDCVFALAGNIPGGPSPAVGSDPRLSFDVSYFSYGAVTGYFVNSITYNQVGLPSPWSQSLRTIANNYFVDLTYPALYQLAGNGTWTGSLFTPASIGMSDMMLTNGSWYGFVQTDEFAGDYAFTQPVAAVPEPHSWSLLIAAAVTMLFLKRKA